jgi:hypothetical protein
MAAVILAMTWVSLAAQVKRWHDLDRSGWMVLLGFVPVVGFIVTIFCLGCQRGTAGANRFGPPPGFASTERTAAVPPRLEATTPESPRPPPLAVPRRRRLRAVGGWLFSLVILAAWFAYDSAPAGDWDTRRTWFRAVLGSAEESQALGWRFREGQGVARDYGQAIKWFQRAAQSGVARANYDLGVIYFYGLGVPEDNGMARRWLEKAVAQRYSPAMTLLGLIAEREQSGSAEALTLWRNAAEAGDPWAESLLGSAHLAARAKEDGSENLILGLYWLERARSRGVEPVGGLLQHVWATVPADQLEAVTGQVFARLERGQADAPPEEVAAAPATVPTVPDSKLGEEVLAGVRAMPIYTRLSTLFAEKIQADPAWATNEEGIAVANYLETMRTDSLATHVQKADAGTPSLEYSVGGNQVTYDGVRIADLDTNMEYRQFVVDALARNIVTAPRPLKVSEFLRNAGNDGEHK